jgi:hypothetical protein
MLGGNTSRAKVPSLSPSDASLLSTASEHFNPPKPFHIASPLPSIIPSEPTLNLENISLDAPSNHGSKSRGEYFLNKKIPQLYTLISLLPPPPDDRGMKVLDVGGGRGDLVMNILDYYKRSFPLRKNLDDVVYVNDNNAASLDTIGLNSDFKNSIKLISADFNTFSIPDSASDGFDVTLALHACGSLSDLVLQRAFSFTKTKIIIVPCCYSKCRAERGSDFLAAAANDNDNEDKNRFDLARICQLCERNDDADTSSKAMAIINELRVRLCRTSSGADWEWEVRTFDREISPKNYVLVGKRLTNRK